jgi:hypothetical protein
MFESSRTSQSLAPTFAVVFFQLLMLALWIAPMIGGSTF